MSFLTTQTEEMLAAEQLLSGINTNLAAQNAGAAAATTVIAPAAADPSRPSRRRSSHATAPSTRRSPPKRRRCWNITRKPWASAPAATATPRPSTQPRALFPVRTCVSPRRCHAVEHSPRLPVISPR